jgi:SH3-like domain-containing protein
MRTLPRLFARLLAGLALAIAFAPPSDPAAAQTLGPETNRPLPRFVTIHAREANMRRGPSTAHRIDWVYHRRGYPLEVVAEHGLWRRVRDRDAAVGWMHHSMLRGWRGAMITEADVALRAEPRADAPVSARAQEGALGRLAECLPAWCRFVADEGGGWAPKSALWGVRADEVFD